MSDSLAEAGTAAPPPVSLTAQRPMLGIALAVTATFLFVCNDTATKILVADYAVPFVAAIRYIVHLGLMVVILGPLRGRELIETKRTGLVIVRGVCLVVATLMFGLALQRMPIAETTSIIFLSPVIVVLLARPLLGERIGILGWVAAIGGFAGVLLIVRPGGGLDPLGVAFMFGNLVVTVSYYLLSRILAHSERTIAMLFYAALAGAVLFGLTIPWAMGGPPPGPVEIALFLSLGVSSGLGHYCFTAANRYAPASVLAPVTYSQLIWAGLFGWAVFGHVPLPLTVLGMVVVGLSGLLVALRQVPLRRLLGRT